MGNMICMRMSYWWGKDGQWGLAFSGHWSCTRCWLYLLVRNDFVWSLTSWWRHQMETFSALLDICAGNSPVPDEFPIQRPLTRSFDVFFDVHPNKQFSKQWWGWWINTPSCPLWRHRNDRARFYNYVFIKIGIKSTTHHWKKTIYQSANGTGY